MVFEIVFPDERKQNGFSSYMESLAPENGLQIIEHCAAATIIEGDWEAAMSFLRQCREYLLQHELGSRTLTTVHIHS